MQTPWPPPEHPVRRGGRQRRAQRGPSGPGELAVHREQHQPDLRRRHDPSEGLASFSNFGATTVDIGAPGTIVLSAGLGRTRMTDGFESNDFAARWAAHVDAGTSAPWGGGPGAASGTSIADSPAGNYANNVRSFADLATPLEPERRHGLRPALHGQVRARVRRRVLRSTVGERRPRSSRLDDLTGRTRRRVPLVRVRPARATSRASRFGFGLESNASGTPTASASTTSPSSAPSRRRATRRSCSWTAPRWPRRTSPARRRSCSAASRRSRPPS